MTEDKLNGLFDEIRNESAQTSVSEVDQWIDAAVATAATVGLLATLKLILIKKPLIMWATLLTITGGVTVSTVLLLNKPQASIEKQKQVVEKSSPDTKNKQEFPLASIAENKPEKEYQTQPFQKENGVFEAEDLNLPLKSVEFSVESKEIKLITSQTTESFTKIHVSGALHVELSQGKSCGVQIEPESAKNLVQVEIKNGTLYLKNTPNKKECKEKLVVKVSVQDLNELHTSGATNVVGMNELTLSTLTLQADGASDVNLKIKASKLKGDFSGASNVDVSGICEDLDLDVSGASQANLSTLSVKNAKVDNSGAGQADLWVSGDLKVDGSGASETTYKVDSGSKSIHVDINTSGAASAKKR
ncbi:head GIN domain-containing protein [Fluviicola taffensis]|uniref:Putative auto-transporter adhesin head GIN domain-containing protein n=1 Tax=Fluviicola taffensis (strain DSM 16823 / NCIMB 13979 / RW262) TaxID=755732 RepID=F2ICF4_FLUTR|nr:head GIN domain-containing protein [Fluviicola taffensis]AEA45424.1 hypothetical protein Fluta_3452 [Fluviicola taffensis DSM 16823]